MGIAMFRDLKMVTTVPKPPSEFANPDTLYDAFTDRLPNLPDDTSNWPYTYHAGLPEELRDALHSHGYKHPTNRNTLNTKAAQFDALTALREDAAKCWFDLQKKTAHLRNLLLPVKQSVRTLSTSVRSPTTSPARKMHKPEKNVSFASVYRRHHDPCLQPSLPH